MPKGTPKSKSTATAGKGLTLNSQLKSGAKRLSSYPHVPASVFAAVKGVAKASGVPARLLTERLKAAYHDAIREAIEAVGETLSAGSIAKQIVSERLDALDGMGDESQRDLPLQPPSINYAEE